MRLYSWLLGSVLALGGAAHAAEPRLSLPISCAFGETCFVQQYPDWDPGPGSKDYTCGPQTYDTHTGLDIRLRDIRAMDANVPVLAAAPGVVSAVRTNMPDAFLDEVRPDLLKNKGCGNAVVLDHGEGWQTWYCHLKRGSVSVRKGDRVRRGQPLAAVGLSGTTEFVHLEFVVRKGKATIDPFTGTEPKGKCGQDAGSLWTDEARNALAYRPAQVLNVGFSGGRVSTRSVENGAHAVPLPESAALHVFTRISHVEPGDLLSVSVTAEGRSIFTREAKIGVDRVKAQWSIALPIDRPETGWPQGPYRAVVKVGRAGETLSEQEFSADPFRREAPSPGAP